MTPSPPKADDRFRALCEVNRAITAALSLEEVLNLICAHAADLLHAESVAMTAIREECEGRDCPCLEVVAASPKARLGLGEYLSIQGSLNGHALATRQVLVVNDVVNDARADKALVEKLGVRQTVIAPLCHGEKPLGTLAIFNSSLGPEFDDDDAEILGALAAQAAVALRNAGLFEMGEQQLAELGQLRAVQDATLKRLHGLIRVGIALSSQLSLDEVLQTLVDSAREAIGARYAALGVLDSSGSSLSRFLQSGVDEGIAEQIGRLPRGGGTLGIMIRDNQTVRLEDVQEHPAFEGFPPGHPHIRSLLGVPVRIRGRVFGNLYLAEKVGKDIAFNDEDEKLAELLAAQAGVAIDTARLYDQRNQFYAIVNHEIKNAAAGVLGWTERMRNVTRDAERRVREGASFAYEGARNLHKLVVDLLDLSQLESRRLELDVSKVDLRALLREVVAAVNPDSEGRAIKVDVSGLGKSAIARTDRARARQILLNILSNAIKFSPEGGKVDVELEGVPNGWSITVRDQGPGVDPDKREHIFEIYARGAGDMGGGSGLGLAISRELAVALGGALVLLDEDSGASFRLTLPETPPTLRIGD